MNKSFEIIFIKKFCTAKMSLFEIYFCCNISVSGHAIFQIHMPIPHRGYYGEWHINLEIACPETELLQKNKGTFLLGHPLCSAWLSLAQFFV